MKTPSNTIAATTKPTQQSQQFQNADIRTLMNGVA